MRARSGLYGGCGRTVLQSFATASRVLKTHVLCVVVLEDFSDISVRSNSPKMHFLGLSECAALWQWDVLSTKITFSVCLLSHKKPGR